ncbi:hypothetical protein JCM11641_001210 [Rhodosporidiobolus odoratus]
MATPDAEPHLHAGEEENSRGRATETVFCVPSSSIQYVSKAVAPTCPISSAGIDWGTDISPQNLFYLTLGLLTSAAVLVVHAFELVALNAALSWCLLISSVLLNWATVTATYRTGQQLLHISAVAYASNFILWGFPIVPVLLYPQPLAAPNGPSYAAPPTHDSNPSPSTSAIAAATATQPAATILVVFILLQAIYWGFMASGYGRAGTQETVSEELQLWLPWISRLIRAVSNRFCRALAPPAYSDIAPPPPPSNPGSSSPLAFFTDRKTVTALTRTPLPLSTSLSFDAFPLSYGPDPSFFSRARKKKQQQQAVDGNGIDEQQTDQEKKKGGCDECSDSTACLIKVEGQGEGKEPRREMLFFEDVEPDSISKRTLNHELWKAAAPKIVKGVSSLIFLECNYPSSHPADRLFGHFSPPFILEEMKVLADLVREEKEKVGLTVKDEDGRGPLNDVIVVIQHIKDDIFALPKPAATSTLQPSTPPSAPPSANASTAGTSPSKPVPQAAKSNGESTSGSSSAPPSRLRQAQKC